MWKKVYNNFLFMVLGFIVRFTFLWIFFIQAMCELTIKDWPGEVLLFWTIRNQGCAIELFQYSLFSNIVGWTKIWKRSTNGIYIYNRLESWHVRDWTNENENKKKLFLASDFNFIINIQLLFFDWWNLWLIW